MALEFHAAPSEPETGLWCGRCLKPSVTRTPLNMLAEDGQGGMMAGTLGWYTECADCGWNPVLASGDPEGTSGQPA